MSTELWYRNAGTWRKAKEVWHRSGGTWLKAKEVWYRQGGVWRKVFAGAFQTVAAVTGNVRGLAEPSQNPGLAELELFTDGTYRFGHTDNVSNMIYDATVNWGAPTTPGLGIDYQYLTAHVRGNENVGGHGVWLPIGTGSIWRVSGFTAGSTDGSSTFDISIRQGTGPTLATGRVVLSGQSTFLN